MNEKMILEGTYNDSYKAYRVEVLKDDNNISTVNETEFESGKCALSVKANKGTSFNTNNLANRVEGIYKIFLKPETAIKAGDKIIVDTQMGQQFTLIANMPFIYVSHTEIEVYRDELC